MRACVRPRSFACEEARKRGKYPKVVTYLETLFNQRHGRETVGLRNTREMRTLPQVRDAPIEGNGARASNVFVQRIKALDTSVIDGGGNMARHGELLGGGLVDRGGAAQPRVGQLQVLAQILATRSDCFQLPALIVTSAAAFSRAAQRHNSGSRSRRWQQTSDSNKQPTAHLGSLNSIIVESQ